MANIGEQVRGPRVSEPGGGGVTPGTSPRPRGAGRDRTARQAGISRPAAPRSPTAGAPRRPRAGGTPGGVGVRPTGAARAQSNLARSGFFPAPPIPGRRPTGQARVPTVVPRRVPAPANVIQLQTGALPNLGRNVGRRRSQLEQAGSFLDDAQRRRTRIRGR